MIDILEADARLLLNAMGEGGCVLVLGAGASASSTNASGASVAQGGVLASIVAKKAGLTYTNEELTEILGAALGRRISDTQFHQILKAEYTKVIPSAELSRLLDYTWYRLYTWNIDDSVENVRGGVQRRRYLNGMVDKVSDSEGLEFLQVIHLHGEALKPEHGFIFSRSEYSARLNKNTHDWYRSAAADYAAHTPIFVGSRLKEPILEAELDRARPNPGAGLGLAFLVTPDEFTDIQKANFHARDIVVIKATLAEFVDWLDSRIAGKLSPVDVATNVSAFARELAKKVSITTADVDTAQSIIIHIWRDAKKDADQLQGIERQRYARTFLEGAPPTWRIAATNIPVWLQRTEELYKAFSKSFADRDRHFIAYGQSGSGKTTAVMQALLRYVNDNDGVVLYELRGEVKSLRSALGLIHRLHREQQVIVYIGDAFIYGDSLAEDILSVPAGSMTLVSSARSREWREHLERRVGEYSTSFEYQRFMERDFDPLIERLLEFVPAPAFRKMSAADRRAKLRASHSQLLIALKETTESEKFSDVITKEFISLPDADCKIMGVLVGIATIARTGVSAVTAREAYSRLGQKRTFEQVLEGLSGIVSVSPSGRLIARHELYVRHIVDNVAPFKMVIDCIVELLRTFTQYKLPIVKNVGRQDGLANLPDAQEVRNVILSDDKVREFVSHAYGLDYQFGLLADTLAITGTRPSQAARLLVGDLNNHPLRPKLMMPKSAKGGGRNRSEKKHERYSVPITVQLAAKLKAAAQGRADNASLLLQSDGSAWGDNPGQSYHREVDRIVNAIECNPDATMYALRHSSITRMLLLNIPVRIVASLHNTSVRMIEKHYSDSIVEHSDDISRRALLQHQGDNNVIALAS